MGQKETAAFFLSVRVQCGGALHKIGITTKGHFVMCEHDMEEFKVMAEFLGDGDHQYKGGKKGGVRDIRCFYVLAQWREFFNRRHAYEKTHFHQTPADLRPFMKIAVDIGSKRRRADNARYGKGPQWKQAITDTHNRAHRRLTDIREHSPIVNESGYVLSSRLTSCEHLHGTWVRASFRRRQGVGYLTYDPDFTPHEGLLTGYRVSVTDTSPIGRICTKEGRLAHPGFSWDPPPALGFRNVSAMRHNSPWALAERPLTTGE